MYVLFQAFGFAGMDDAHKAGFAEVSFFADRFAPVLEHVQADQGELNLGRIAVMHADESGRTATASLTDMALIDDYNFSRLPFREMERN